MRAKRKTLRAQLDEVTAKRDTLIEALGHALMAIALEKSALHCERLGLSPREDRRRAARRRAEIKRLLVNQYPTVAAMVLK